MRMMLTREVADVLRVSEEHVRDLIRQNKLNAYKEGRRGGYRIHQEEVERYIKERFQQEIQGRDQVRRAHSKLPRSI